MKLRPIFLALALLPLMAACETPEHLSPDFGNAVRFNMAAQTIRPEPVEAAADETRSSDVSALAYERYRTNKVKQPMASARNPSLGQGAAK